VSDVVAAVGQRAVIARWDEQEPAALAAIRPGSPKSTIHCHHLSSNIPSDCGGVSTTIGPGLRSTMLKK
jgi:hypothetical protein